MGLFGKERPEAELADLRANWTGRLSDELWEDGAGFNAFNETAHQLLVQYAETSLRSKAKPLPKTVAAGVQKLLPVFVPRVSAWTSLADASTTAYLLSSAEVWSDLDRAEFRRRADIAWARYCAVNPRTANPRFRAGITLVGLTDRHPSQPDAKRVAGFDDVADYVSSQPSFARLSHLEAVFSRETLIAFHSPTFSPQPVHDEDEDEFNWNHARAWHLGICAWLIEWGGLLP